MIKKYLASRSGSVKFLLLAILFSLFVVGPQSDGILWARSIAFLFASFIVFRFIDDAGSVAIDRREHPERTYLHAQHYPLFLGWTIVLALVYLLAVLLSDARAFYVLTALITVSAGLYIIFRERKFLLELVPLLKYPVLLWCLSLCSMDPSIVAPIVATFFIIFTHDILEKVHAGKLNLLWGIVPLIISGLLIFRPWNDLAGLWFILPALFLAFVFQRSKNIKYLPVLYYPILAFVIKIN